MKHKLLSRNAVSGSNISIDLVGALRVMDGKGNDLTPVGKKNKGLLAILCVSPGFRCSRAKLQDKLWSDRTQEQGSNSLRQALTLLRRVLNKDSEVLLTPEDWVHLNTECVTVKLEPAAIYSKHTLPEFAEGLQINDPEFEDWIRDQRSHFEQLWHDQMVQKNRSAPYPYNRDLQMVTVKPTMIIIAPPFCDDPELHFAAQIILRDAAKRASSYGDFVIVEESEQFNNAENALRLVCMVSKFGGKVGVQPMLLVEQSRRIIWNQTFECEVEQIREASNEVSDALTLAILKSGNALISGEILSADLPLGDIFGYSQIGLYSADNYLENADGEREVPAFLSLRAYIRHTMLMERVTEHSDASLDEANEMISKALERAPYDPFTLSVRALISGLQDQDELALDYAQRAIQSDQKNAFAQHCLSVALSFSGYPEEANAAALMAKSSRLAVISPAIYFLRYAYTALGVGNEKEALRYAKMAHGTAPNFRPALRVIAALSYREHDEDVAVKHLNLLRLAEPDFTLDLMAEPDYPVDSLRKAGALGIVKSRLI